MIDSLNEQLPVCLGDWNQMRPWLSTCAVRHWVCITDSNVMQTAFFKRWWKDFCHEHSGYLCWMPAGEAYKNQKIKTALETELLAQGFRRDIGIIAVGGGVVLDLAGFIAATFCRGVPWIACPTTWMGMVDVCVGGKTAINTAFGKNTLGAIYPPQQAWISFEWLDSLPESEYRWACAEVIKMALITGAERWHWLKAHVEGVMRQDPKVLRDLLSWVLAAKWQYVQSDLQDHGARQMLNFGHTLAHAIEQVSSYRVPHGQAVVWGMLMACQLSMQRLGLDIKVMEALMGLVTDFKCLVPIQGLCAATLIQACSGDKKRTVKGARWIGLRAIGVPDWIDEVNSNHLHDALQVLQCCSALPNDLITKATFDGALK